MEHERKTHLASNEASEARSEGTYSRQSFTLLRTHFEGELAEVKASFSRVQANTPEDKRSAFVKIVQDAAQPLKNSLTRALTELQRSVANSRKQDDDYLNAGGAGIDLHEKAYLVRLLIAELDALVRANRYA